MKNENERTWKNEYGSYQLENKKRKDLNNASAMIPSGV